MLRKRFMTFFIAAASLVAVTYTVPVWACASGEKAEVLWNGSWYPAKVLKGKGHQCLIHYDGYGNNWDEWVGPDRIKIAYAPANYREGDPVQILWKGSWWPAHVIGMKGSQLKIHYDGYDSSWDEWVGPDRYRRP